MCHGLIDKCATVPVPDLLRAVLYENNPDDKSYDVDDSMFGSDSVLPGSSDLADDEALADIVNDHSLAVEKFNSEDVDNIIIGAADEKLGLTGSLSTWFDCIKDDLFSATDLKSAADVSKASKLLPQDDTTVKVVPKSRKVRKSAAVKEQIHAKHDSEMDNEAPVLIDEKKKRRMSSNRLSAQRSRQRKQDRLDELEILTAQLRLENATLSRRSKLAEQVAKKFQSEKNALAKEVEELRRELEAIRHSSRQGLPDSGDESKDVNSGVCNMVEGSISDASILELEMSSKGDSENVSMQFDAKKRNISSPDLSRAMFQELYDAIDSDQFDVTIGAEVPEEWLGSFTKCLNAGD